MWAIDGGMNGAGSRSMGSTTFIDPLKSNLQQAASMRPLAIPPTGVGGSLKSKLLEEPHALREFHQRELVVR
jgi:hypothetical protein